jgi:hypothetical protein
MTHPLALRTLTLALSLGVAVFATSTPARADVAERCGWRGCAYIHCNWTGDRCYRVDEDGIYRGYYGDDDDDYGDWYDGDRYHGDDDDDWNDGNGDDDDD